MTGIFRRPFIWAYLPRHPTWVPSAGLVTTLTAEQGTYSVVGQEARFRLGLGAAQGAYSKAGQTAPLNIAIIPAQGNYVYAGQDVNLVARLPVILVAEQGTYSLTGHDLSFDLSLAIGQGAYTIVGQDLRFTTTFVVNHGTYNLIGQDVRLVAKQSQTLEAEHGAYSISGQDVSLRIITRPVVTQVGDDYPWPEATDHRKKQWQRELEAKRRLRRQVAEAVESLEARAETGTPEGKAAAKTLRQVRRRYGEVLDFERMLGELSAIRKIFAEYAGARMAELAILAYQASIAEQITEEEALVTYEAWERDHVQRALSLVAEFSDQLVGIRNAKKVDSVRH